MPINSTRDIIDFVNQLEERLVEMKVSVDEWNSDKHRLRNAANRVDSNYTTAISALVRADEAMAEIGTATFQSTASRGKRLEDTLNKLRDEMYEIASQVGGSGGGDGGALTEGMFFDELNNAISSVDVTIEDGLKLDYRIREITRIAEESASLTNKPLYVPYKYEVDIPSMNLELVADEGVVFIDGDVTVLDQEGNPFLDDNNEIIVGTITSSGEVALSHLPKEGYTIYFPVQMALKDVPEDFLYLFLQQIIDKNSKIMQSVLRFESTIQNVLNDIDYMKGVNWTPDYSIMRNHQELVKESITPKGLHVEVKDGMAHATFSYNDHPYLSHFIMEKWDDNLKRYVPFDGVKGIVQK